MKKYIISFAIILVMAVLLIGCGQKTKVLPSQGDAPESPSDETSDAAPPETGDSGAQTDDTETSAPEDTGLEETEMEELKDCETEYAIGWIPNSCDFDGETFKITLKAVGDGGIDGVVFYVIGPTDIKKVLKDETDVASGDSHAYSFSVEELEDDVGGSIDDILALPVKNQGGKDYACFNQRLKVIKDLHCVG